jgi:hypothetical protein
VIIINCGSNFYKKIVVILMYFFFSEKNHIKNTFFQFFIRKKMKMKMKKKMKKLCVSKETYNYISFLGLSFLVITLRTKIYSHYKITSTFKAMISTYHEHLCLWGLSKKAKFREENIRNEQS